MASMSPSDALASPARAWPDGVAAVGVAARGVDEVLCCCDDASGSAASSDFAGGGTAAEASVCGDGVSEGRRTSGNNGVSVSVKESKAPATSSPICGACVEG